MTLPAPLQQRLAVFLISLIIIFVEITLMRELALRYWEHLAWLVVSIALLGFGASGTVLVLLHRYLHASKPTLQFASLLGMSLSMPISLWLGDMVDLNLIQMVWQPSIVLRIGLLQLALGIPFFFGGIFIGLVLQDRPEHIPGHYAASFLGSGAGGLAVLPLLYWFAPRLMIIGCGIVILATSLLYVQTKLKTGYWLFTAVLLTIIVWQIPHASRISDDKDLPQLLAMPESSIVAKRYSPQGKLELIEAPAFHAAPGLALNNIEPVPPQRFITVDAQIVDTIYQTASPDDFAFLDQTTQALPYRLNHFDHALIVDDAGISHLALALYHRVGTVTNLISNGVLADLEMKELSSLNPYIHKVAQISFINRTVRGYLRKSTQQYPLIIFPTIGTDPGGLSAAAADSLLTQETLRLCLSHLDKQGVLALSTFVHSPPRESLRLLNMLVAALREIGKEPQRHIAIIRNWATVTIVASKRPLTKQQINRIRLFCLQRRFDLVWLPDLMPDEVNRYHQFQNADYHLAATLLLGQQNSQFVANYIYDLSPPDETKPFFHHFSRWRGIRELKLQLGKRGRVYSELGWLLLIAAFCQALVLAFICILLPLIPAIGLPGKKTEKIAVLGFFSAIGLGFMLLEMGFLQRLTVYLAHPVYAAATVLSGFLFFGGIGSIISSRLPEPLLLTHRNLGFAIVMVGSTILVLCDRFLQSTEASGLVSRMVLAFALIAPLAILMGMMFPLGLKRVGRSQDQLIPWAWSANGFSSVIATIAAPILAMQWGFDLVVWAALGCYGLATMLSLRLPS
jgi:hypothetical protein